VGGGGGKKKPTSPLWRHNGKKKPGWPKWQGGGGRRERAVSPRRRGELIWGKNNGFVKKKVEKRGPVSRKGKSTPVKYKQKSKKGLDKEDEPLQGEGKSIEKSEVQFHQQGREGKKKGEKKKCAATARGVSSRNKRGTGKPKQKKALPEKKNRKTGET